MAHTTRQPDHVGPTTDRFALIIASHSPQLDDPAWGTDWTDLITDAGTLIVLTHRDGQGGPPTSSPAAVSRSAALAGLTLIDRLILLHRDPSPRSPVSDRDRQRVALGGHVRVHTEALVFEHCGGVA